MSCKTALYAANTNAQATLATGTVVNFGGIVRRFGCGLSLSGGNVEIREAGYYDVDVNLAIEPGAGGTVTAQLFNGGVAVPGANATFDVAANVAYAVTIPAIVRTNCNCTSTITVVVSGVAATVNNAAISVEKI